MAELDKITLKMALFALVLGLVGCVVGWLGGSIHTEKELNRQIAQAENRLDAAKETGELL